MNYYEIWCNLKDSTKDLEFCENVGTFLGRMASQGKIAGYQIRRRKLGFGPKELGEFNITIHVENLGQLESAFELAATRGAVIEPFHKAVYSMVKDLSFGLSRDFPDAVRERE